MLNLLYGLQRHALLFTFLGSSSIVLAAFAYQAVTGLQPCHLCWIQRGLFMALAVISLIAWMCHRWMNSFIRLSLAGLLAVCALTGLGVAVRHLYIKLNPHTVSCGMDVQTLLDFLPLFEALQEMLLGSADCAQSAPFLGLPLPSWTFSGYLVLGLLGLYGLVTDSVQRA